MSNRPRVEWLQQGATPVLRFTFGEHLSEVDAAAAIEDWRACFAEHPDAKVPIVWDAVKMRGYDSGARRMWTETLKELKPRIGPIWLVSESSVIRMGASVMSMLSGLDIHPVRSMDAVRL